MKLADVRGLRALAAALVLVIAPVVPAHAQSAEAEVLFREGRALIKQGKLAAGCDKLEASERAESSVGTLLNLGDCREKLGRIASAWASFRKAESLAQRTGRDDKRRAEAGRRAAALEPRLANLVIEVKHPVDGLIIRRDHDVVERGAWGTAVPVDPDTYAIVAEAPGFKPWRTEVTIDGRLRRKVVTIPRLAVAPVSLAPPPATPPPAVVEEVSPPAERPLAAVPIQYTPKTWTTTRKVAVGVAVLGAGALGFGAYYGVRASDLGDRADARCPTSTCNDAEALDLNDRAQSAALRANVGFVAGGALVATAAIMWLAGGPDRAAGERRVAITPSLGDRAAGIAFAGRF